MLFGAFRQEISDPEYFYSVVATDTALALENYLSLKGATVVDVGGGPGFFSREFIERGANCLLVEPMAEPLHVERTQFRDAHDRHDYLTLPGRLMKGSTLAGDGMALGLRSDVADLTFSSNVLEHIPRPADMLAEMWRVTKPGGILYMSYTLWWSPWGGHETSPWHFLGGHYAARRFEKKHGRRPSNYYGESLFTHRVGPVLKIARSLPHSEIDIFPRYYPRWTKWIVSVPFLRELLAWNVVVVLRKAHEVTP